MITEADLIDEVSLDLTGWARFSADRTKRYRLGRVLDSGIGLRVEDGRVVAYHWAPDGVLLAPRRVVFVMLNPSTADAFKPDRTIDKCVQFAQRWGAQVVEAVNLFAFRSPYPEDLDVPGLDRGLDELADAQILDACRGAYRVIAAWGNHGWRAGRDQIVRRLLREQNIPLMTLGFTKEGRPLHPLARGKHFIPLEREPTTWGSL